MTKATRAGLVVATGAMAAWLAMAGPLPSTTEFEGAESGAGLAQTAPITWTRASCLAKGAARHVETYLNGRGQGLVWVRYDGDEGAGAGEVVALALAPGVAAREVDIAAAIAKRFPEIQGGGWPDLRGFWAVTSGPAGTPSHAWLGAHAWDGSAWTLPAPPVLPTGAEQRLSDVSISDGSVDERVWVPFEANYGCPQSVSNCRQVGVKAFEYVDARTGIVDTGAYFLPTVASGAARYNVPDVMLVPRLDDGDAWVVGHGEVYVLPFDPQRGRPVPLPVIDVAKSIGGYATAAARDLKGRLIVALWTEQRTPNGLLHGITIHALDGREWATQAISLTGSPLFERGAAFDRVTGLAVDPNGSSLWATSYGGGVLEIDASVFARPQWLNFFDRSKLGLAADERILDIAVAGSGDNRLIVLGTTNGVIASRDVCGGAPPRTATGTPGSTGPTTPASRETETPTATVDRATATETSPIQVSPTPTPTRPSPPVRPVYLPFALAGGALTDDGSRPLDVVWLIDNSASMRAPFPSGRMTRLAAVVGALGPRVGKLPEGDQAAIVAFDEPTKVLASLTRDEDTLAKALGALVDSAAPEGSRLDLGLTVARRELAGPTRRPGVPAAVVVLSDGTSTREPSADEVSKAAEALRRAGVAIWAVGLGPDVDAAWLAAAAGEARVLRANDALELDAALNRIDRALRAVR